MYVYIYILWYKEGDTSHFYLINVVDLTIKM